MEQGLIHPGSGEQRAGQDALAGRELMACLGKEGSMSAGVPSSYYSILQRHGHGSSSK